VRPLGRELDHQALAGRGAIESHIHPDHVVEARENLRRPLEVPARNGTAALARPADGEFLPGDLEPPLAQLAAVGLRLSAGARRDGRNHDQDHRGECSDREADHGEQSDTARGGRCHVGYGAGMSDDLSPRSGSRLSRSQRENRGFRLVAIGGVAGAVAVVGTLLAIIGVVGWSLPFLAVAVAAVCGFLFRRLAR